MCRPDEGVQEEDGAGGIAVFENPIFLLIPYRVLKQAEEELASVMGRPSVETKDILIEVVIEVRVKVLGYSSIHLHYI